MNYEVGGKWVFATFKEACGFADMIAKKTRYILCVAETNRKVNHVYNGGK